MRACVCVLACIMCSGVNLDISVVVIPRRPLQHVASMT